MKIVRKLKPFHTDDRGDISHILKDETPITSALLITSKKGAIRANHWHKNDTHYVYLTKGKMEYTYRDIKAANSRKRTIIVNAGEVIETPPMTEHAMKFLEDSVFIAFTTEPRDQKHYETDTTRIKLI